MKNKFEHNATLERPNPLISQSMETSMKRINPKSITKEEL